MLLTSWLRNVSGNVKSDSKRRDRAASRRKQRADALASQVEMLEDKTLLSVTVIYTDDVDDPADPPKLQVTASPNGTQGQAGDDEAIVQTTGGVLEVLTREHPIASIPMTPGMDQAAVDTANAQAVAAGFTNDEYKIYRIVVDPSITQDFGANQLSFFPSPGVAVAAQAATLQELAINGNDGINRFDLSLVTTASGFDSTVLTSIDVFGGGQGDSLIGSDFDDLLRGGTDEDTLDGGLGSDTLNGQAGGDRLNGGDGNDEIRGGEGNDVLDGGDGDDDMRGNSGRDAMEGGDGADTMMGNSGRDTLSGDAGRDCLSGNTGEDQIYGGADNDSLQGGDNDDLLDGGSGDDTLEGEANDDVLIGGGGADLLLGGDGADELHSVSGFGDDEVIVRTASGVDSVRGAYNDASAATTLNSEFDPAIAINPNPNETVGDETINIWATQINPGNPTQLAVSESTDGGSTYSLYAPFLDGGGNPFLGGSVTLAWDLNALGQDGIAGNADDDTLYAAFVDQSGGLVVTSSFDADNFTFMPGAVGIGALGASVAHPTLAVGPGRPVNMGGIDADGDGVSDERSVWLTWEDTAAKHLHYAAWRIDPDGTAQPCRHRRSWTQYRRAAGFPTSPSGRSVRPWSPTRKARGK